MPIPPNCEYHSIQEYGRVMVPISVYGTMPFIPSDYGQPAETMVDERISQTSPSDHDGNGTYLGSLNISSSETTIERTIGFSVEPWASFVGIYQDGVYYPYEQISITARVNIAAVEVNDKGFYHQFRNACVYDTTGGLLGTSTGSGELSLSYQTFSFEITPVDEDAWNTYWSNDHSPSGAVITIDYYHTHDNQPDNARLTAMSLEVRGSYYTAYCWDGSGGIIPDSGGDNIFGNNALFKMLMVGDK